MNAKEIRERRDAIDLDKTNQAFDIINQYYILIDDILRDTEAQQSVDVEAFEKEYYDIPTTKGDPYKTIAEYEALIDKMLDALRNRQPERYEVYEELGGDGKAIETIVDHRDKIITAYTTKAECDRLNKEQK